MRAKNHPEGLRLAGKTGKAPTSLRAAQKTAPKDLITLGSGEQAVTLQWKGGLPKPELDGTTARYNEAVPGADVIVEATRTDDGTEHLLDDTRYDPPAFTENCGRSSMSGKINQGSMSHFGEFARQLRLIDEDRYLLDPCNAWFRGCDASKADLVRTMTKP